MIGDVILPSTTAAEWPKIRAEIRARVLASMGEPPEDLGRAPATCEELERYEKHGLTHVRIRYHVVDDLYNEMICVLPATVPACPGDALPLRSGLRSDAVASPAPAVLCMHGTNRGIGAAGVIDPTIPKRAYVGVAPDLLGFGASIAGSTQKDVIDAFFKRYPAWSLDGVRLADHTRAIDALETLPFVAKGGVGAIGNSLGGRSVMYVAALDERVRAAVSSTGVSPNATNVFRSCTIQTELSPALSRAIMTHGKIPWDYHEMIALAAPRALLAIEPWNDTENPYVAPIMECFRSATAAWRLLGHPERVSLLIHGEGHDTPDGIREYAYRWFDRFLK